MHTTEMRMLRWARGKIRLDHVMNVDILKEARVYPMAEFIREKRLRWFGHVQCRDEDEEGGLLNRSQTINDAGRFQKDNTQRYYGDVDAEVDLRYNKKRYNPKLVRVAIRVT